VRGHSYQEFVRPRGFVAAAASPKLLGLKKLLPKSNRIYRERR
jgi:hypothetical protein